MEQRNESRLVRLSDTTYSNVFAVAAKIKDVTGRNASANDVVSDALAELLRNKPELNPAQLSAVEA